jgi:elongation factor P
MQYLYSQNDELIMMDLETYDQIPLDKALVDNKTEFMKEGAEVLVKWGGNKPLSVALPTTVELKVTECDPGVAGDTVQGGTKPVTLETGAIIQVPLFIEKEDMLKVDTRTGEYIERSN